MCERDFILMVTVSPSHSMVELQYPVETLVITRMRHLVIDPQPTQKTAENDIKTEYYYLWLVQDLI